MQGIKAGVRVDNDNGAVDVDELNIFDYANTTGRNVVIDSVSVYLDGYAITYNKCYAKMYGGSGVNDFRVDHTSNYGTYLWAGVNTLSRVRVLGTGGPVTVDGFETATIGDPVEGLKWIEGNVTLVNASDSPVDLTVDNGNESGTNHYVTITDEEMWGFARDSFPGNISYRNSPLRSLKVIGGNGNRP